MGFQEEWSWQNSRTLKNIKRKSIPVEGLHVPRSWGRHVSDVLK
jgi:hypothetical protein